MSVKIFSSSNLHCVIGFDVSAERAELTHAVSDPRAAVRPHTGTHTQFVARSWSEVVKVQVLVPL